MNKNRHESHGGFTFISLCLWLIILSQRLDFGFRGSVVAGSVHGKLEFGKIAFGQFSV